jgi:hypothetical protein
MSDVDDQDAVTHAGQVSVVLHSDDDGGFAPQLTLAGRQRRLAGAEAGAYAAAVLRVAAEAAYDAACFRQTAALAQQMSGGPDPGKFATRIVGALRARRPAYDDAATWPLVVRPEVSQEQTPLVSYGDEDGWIGYWEIPMAVQHAVGIQSIADSGAVGTTHYALLTGELGFEPELAVTMIRDLAYWLDPGWLLRQD